MSTEIFWLTLTVAMTGLLWAPYILDRIMVRGLMGAMANPSPNDKGQSPWARRLMAAHTNAVENLVIFAPLVLTARYRLPPVSWRRCCWCSRSLSWSEIASIGALDELRQIDVTGRVTGA